MSILSSGTVRLILTVIVIVVLFVILFRFRRSRRAPQDSLDFMKERLEKGEITEEEFEAARRRQIP